MKTVLVTGASGFVGKNLCAQLEQNQEIKVLRFDRENTNKDLETYVVEADFIFHLAGVNRPKNESEFDSGNRGLTETLLLHITACGKKTPVVITSSIQAELDNPYGKSKQAAEHAVRSWASKTGAIAYIFRLPNVFGKWSRANYNSAVATFCNNIANDQDISIRDPKAKVTLVYIDDVVDEFISVLNGKARTNLQGFCDVQHKTTLTLQKLVDKLYSFKEMHVNSVIPDFKRPFDRSLYATFTSFFDQKSFGYNLEMKCDERGWLSEFIKSRNSGQVFISRTKPGVARGNHWHRTKVEKFLVIDGKADIKFRLYGTDEILTYSVTGQKLQVIDIPSGYIHSIINTGSTDLLTLFWSSEIFDPNNPDTYYEEV